MDEAIESIFFDVEHQNLDVVVDDCEGQGELSREGLRVVKIQQVNARRQKIDRQSEEVGFKKCVFESLVAAIVPGPFPDAARKLYQPIAPLNVCSQRDRTLIIPRHGECDCRVWFE